MATLRALAYFDAPGGNITPGGSRSLYKEFTVSEPKFDQTKLVAHGPSGTTWDAWGHTSEDPISDFDFLFIVSDLSGVLVELTCDKGGENGAVPFVLGLIAGFPLMLGSNVSRALHTADFQSGVADVIDRVRIHNPSTTTSANVRVALFT